MRLRATKSAHSVSYSVIKSAYINKKRTTVTVEKLGNEKEICKKYGVSDALAWAKEYVANLNKNAERNKPIDISFDPSIPLTQNDQRLFNGGYLSYRIFIFSWDLIRFAKLLPESMDLSTTSIQFFQGCSIQESFILLQNCLLSRFLQDS